MKAKSHSGAKKRFKKTASGKVTAKKCGRKHLLEHKGKSRMRRIIRGTVLTGGDAKLIKSLLQN